MAAFAEGTTQILVATTVIEVGRRYSAGNDHGDRACRAVRACPIASIARKSWARRRQILLPIAL